ncbi:hypothetical protein NCS52_01089200 [Fusarium sp. LHS14.1]|nr:hypothetical protein NCS52_01089200 [Fusarium sp. LHS14.1]
MSTNDTNPADLEPSASAVGGMFILFACCVMILFICFLVARCGFKDRSRSQPSTLSLHLQRTVFHHPAHPPHLLRLWFGDLGPRFCHRRSRRARLISSRIPECVGATAAISAPHFLLPSICSRYYIEQGSDVPASRPPTPGLAQPSEQVSAQGRHLEQDDTRSWSLDLESAFASEEEQPLL